MSSVALKRDLLMDICSLDTHTQLGGIHSKMATATLSVGVVTSIMKKMHILLITGSLQSLVKKGGMIYMLNTKPPRNTKLLN